MRWTSGSSTQSGFIGAGNMASAIIGGLIANSTEAQSITAADPYPPQLEKLSKQLGINTTDDNNAPLTLLAHNGKRYDARILVFEHDRHGLGLPRNLYHADTIDVFKQIFPGRRSYKLGELHAWVLGRELENAHDAMADVDGMCALLSHVGRGAVGAAVEASSEALESIAQRCGVAVAQAEVVAQVERRQAELFMAAPAADPAEAA